MSIFNTVLIIVIFIVAIASVLFYINKNKNAEVEQVIEKNDKICKEKTWWNYKN